MNLFYHERDYGLGATWHFFGSGHGKNSCDGIAGKVKMLARDATLHLNTLISNSEEFFAWATTAGPQNIKFFHVTSEMVANVIDRKALESRYSKLSTIQYTQRVHMVSVSENRLNCFELSSDKDVLCSRDIETPALPAVVFTNNMKGEHFICIYEGAWYPVEVREIDMQEEEVKVDFYKRNTAGYFTKEGAYCWIPFIDIVKAISLPRVKSSRRFILDESIILEMDAYVSQLGS